MIKFKNIISAAVAAVITLNSLSFTAFAADKTPQQIVEDMRLGWNLGNTLDSFGGGSDPTAAENYWVHVITDKKMIDDVKAQGFNTIRVPVTWYEKITDGKINENWLKRVKEVVDYGIDNNMYVILNTHHETAGIVPSYEKAGSSEAYLRNLWSQIAPYFKDYDYHLIFETMNEPRIEGSEEQWTNGTEETRYVINKLNAAAVEEIRKTGGNNSTRLVMCPGNAAAVPAASGFELPNDKYIALSVHNYAPVGFALDKDGTAQWGSEADKTEMNAWMKDLYFRFVSKGTPVIIGEMGATDKLNTSAREIWAKYYAQTAKSYGITCVVWDNNVISASGGDFGEHYGLYNRSSHSWYYPGIVKALNDGVDAAVPFDGGSSDAYTTVLFSGENVSLSNWATQVITGNIPVLSPGYKIAVEFDGETPCIVMQNYNIKEWNVIEADKAEKNVAYFNYESIEAGCKTGYANQNQMLVMAKGNTSIINKVSVIAPHKNGDVTNDGVVDRYDAREMIVCACGLGSVFSMFYGDMDGSGSVDLIDIIAALKAEQK